MNERAHTTDHQTSADVHTPVLLQETITYLDPQPGEVVVDGTLGGGGHALELCKHIGTQGILIGIDADAGAVAHVRRQFAVRGACAHIFFEDNFRNIAAVVKKAGFSYADKIIFDLGLSSFQLESSKGWRPRGFSFKRDEPLLMTFRQDAGTGVTAQDVVNTWSEEHLADIIYGFGEERYARRIAHAVVEAREQAEIRTSNDLAEIVARSVPVRAQRKHIHPATKTFQAIRMAVNEETQSLTEGMQDGFALLSTGGRMAIITFHSIEDRIVKRFFREKKVAREGELITKKAIIPAEDEIANNPRARSAKLRVIEKT